MRMNSVGRFFAPSLEDPAYVARRFTKSPGHQFGGTNALHGVESMTRSVSANGAAAVLIRLSGYSQSIGYNDISGLGHSARPSRKEWIAGQRSTVAQ